MAYDSEHWKEIERRDDSKLGTLTSPMNNAKWRKLITGIANSGLALPVCERRFIRNDHWFRWTTPGIDDIDETGVLDHGHLQPFLFKEVERVRWPRRYEVKRGRGIEPWRRTQDLDGLEASIESIGRFDYETDNDALTPYAYRE